MRFKSFPFFYIFKGDLDAEKDFESTLSLCFCNILGVWRCASYGTPFLMAYEKIVNDVEWKKGKTRFDEEKDDGRAWE
jgi:hypothetical protein